MIPDGYELFKVAQSITKNIVYFLPRNASHFQLFELSGKDERCEMEQNYLWSKLKTVTAYYGDLIDENNIHQEEQEYYGCDQNETF
jgi:trimethylguanosine synthase